MSNIGYFQVDDVTLRGAPARDSCFSIVYRDAEMHEFGDMSDTSRREMLHRHMSNEITSLDIAADCLAQFHRLFGNIEASHDGLARGGLQ